MVKPGNHLKFQYRDQWRRWLEKHHTIETEAWLILYKKKYQDQGLALDEAIEEALCFGWIDGKLNRLDEKCFMLRFSPRTETSIWSMSNIRRVEKLIKAGKMTEAGEKKINQAQENGQWEAAIRREQVDIIPEDLASALHKVDGAITAYRALPASRKKQYIYWLQSAKRKETKQSRIQKIIEEILNQ
jgi:uncharacterized protein YdeI (YjbR/CyaY-like superfamily)